MNYNGLIASLTKDGSTASQTLTGVSYVRVVDSVPGKFFSHGQFAVTLTQGVSGAIGINVIGGIGGATYAIAGRTNLSGVGSFPLPAYIYGVSGNPVNTGYPRPAYVTFESAKAVSGFTAQVFFAGDYV